MATINKRGNKYRIRVYMGYDVNGKQIERTKTWTAPSDWSEKRAEKEAQRQALLFEEEIRNGALQSSMKFSVFADYWLKMYAESNLRQKTIFDYRKLLKQINLAIGHIPLEKITPIHLLEFYKTLASTVSDDSSYFCTVDLKPKIKSVNKTQSDFAHQSGVSLTTLASAIRGKPISKRSAELISRQLGERLELSFQPTTMNATISASTIRHYHRLISSILSDAVKWQYIPYNPCSRITPPKSTSAEISYLDDVQAKQLLTLLQHSPAIYRRAITLLLLTGLRRSELMGLEWTDIDFVNHTMTIRRTSQYLPHQGIYTDKTKNRSSQRIMVISPQVIHILREQQDWQQRESQRLGEAWCNNDRIITNEDGTAMSPNRLSNWFYKFIRSTDLPPIHLHSLRHTYATLCIANGVPLTAVAAQLGHATVATTANIYAHAIKSAQVAAADKIGQLFASSI